jgi:D-alanyl-D-alanine carboxypeptidase/D-alanyl-D-alanine-endopeptidase (penicillin-binding protein 4)
MREGITLRVDRRSVVVFSWLLWVAGFGWMRPAPAQAADGALLAPTATASAPTLGAADPARGGTPRGGLDPDALAQVLDPVLQDPLLSRASAGIHVVDLATGDEVYNHSGDVPFIPASTMKVVTTAVALKTLGPAYEFSTHVYRHGELAPDGVLDGDLYVKGFGDPTLTVERLWRLVHDVSMQGVVEVDGNVVFDDDFFGDDYLVPGWTKKVDIANGPTYFAPLGALSLNFNTACIIVAPGSAANSPARVVLDTPASVLAIDNQVRTVGPGGRRWLRIEREVDPKAHTVTFHVAGQIPLDSDVLRFYRTVDRPTDHFMAVFADLLKQQGIKVKGKYLDGTTPDDDETVLVARSDSEPLGTLIRQLMKQSNNLMAEHVLKTVGAEVYGVPGTTAKGLEVVKTYLDGLGIPRDEYVIVNGSGLSLDARLRPSVLTAILADMYHDRDIGPEFAASLSIGGIDGTLWHRFREDDEVSRVRGKTGSINGVHCLAGILEAGDGSMLAFAVMLNDLGNTATPARRVEDGLVRGMLHMGEVQPTGAVTSLGADDIDATPAEEEP